VRELDPRVPSSLEHWRSDAQLSDEQLEQLSEMLERYGYFAERASDGMVYVEGEEDEHLWEEFCFGPNGGCVSKPSYDPDKADEIFGTVFEICSQAGWVVYDLQTGEIAYGIHLLCSECGQAAAAHATRCPNGHSLHDAAVQMPIAALEPPAQPPPSPAGREGAGGKEVGPRRRAKSEVLQSFADALIEVLLAEEAIELDGDRARLESRFAHFWSRHLNRLVSGTDLGAAAAEWLVDQPEVADLFADDASLDDWIARVWKRVTARE
jgi:hypothetical protein